MKKKVYTLIILFFFPLLLNACQSSNMTNEIKKTENQMMEETAKATQYKAENLKVIPKKKFISQNINAECDENGWTIIYANNNRILMTEGYFLVVLEKKDNFFKIKTIIDLMKYDVDNFYTEEGTDFYPSSDGQKLLVFNETFIKDNGVGISYEKDKKLKSILIDFKQKKVTFYKGNNFKDLRIQEGISEKNVAKEKKTPISIQKIQNKFVRIKNEGTVVLENNKTITSVRECDADKARRLEWGLYMYDLKTAKAERVFGFQ